MKNLLFFSLLCLPLFFASCNKNEAPGPELPEVVDEGKANFKVVLTLSGDLENFAKAFSIGSGFVYSESGEEVQELSNDDLTEGSHIFISKEPLKEVELGASFVFSPLTTSDPKVMIALVEVYSGDDFKTLVDSKEWKLASEDFSEVFSFKYEVK